MGCQVPNQSESSLTFVPSPPHPILPIINLCVRIIGKGKEQKQKTESTSLSASPPLSLPPSLLPEQSSITFQYPSGPQCSYPKKRRRRTLPGSSRSTSTSVSGSNFQACVEHFIGRNLKEKKKTNWGATSGEKTVPRSSSVTPFTRNKKRETRKRFLSTWMNIFFQASVLSYTVCFYIKACV